MLDHDLAYTALRVAILPLFGALGALSILRDQAARVRVRVRDGEGAAEWAVSWTNLSPEQRAVLTDWTDLDRALI